MSLLNQVKVVLDSSASRVPELPSASQRATRAMGEASSYLEEEKTMEGERRVAAASY